MSIKEQIYQLAKKGRKKPRIGIGILNPTPSVMHSLKQAQEYAQVVVIGKSVKDFESIKTQKVERVGIEMYKNKKIEGLIRGQGDAFIFRDYIASLLNYDLKDIIDASLVEDNFNRIFFISPVSQPQGWTKTQKIAAVQGMAKLIKNFGLKPKIGFLTAVRPGSRGKNFFLDLTYEIADECVEWCFQNGLEAKNYNIETEKALDDGCNILVPPNGVAGNQMLRTIKFLANLPIYASVILGIKENIVESFRNEHSFLNYFIYLTATINKKIK